MAFEWSPKLFSWAGGRPPLAPQTPELQSGPFLVRRKRIAAAAAEVAAKSLQSCPTLCDPIDSSPPGSPVPGILQARTLERVAISFTNAWKWRVKVKLLSRVWLFVTPWTAAYQAPPSMGFSRQEYWSRVPLPSPRKRIASGLFAKMAQSTESMSEFLQTVFRTKNRVNDGELPLESLSLIYFPMICISPLWIS